MKKDIRAKGTFEQQVANKERQSKQRAQRLGAGEQYRKPARQPRIVQVSGKPPLPGIPERTVGIDLGDQFCAWHQVEREGNTTAEGRVPTAELGEWLRQLAPSRVVMETGTHVNWASREAIAAGHEVYAANAREFRAIYKNPNKSDRVDAAMLAEMGRVSLRLLYPVELRAVEVEADEAILQARDVLVQARTKLINSARNQVKSRGGRLPSCDADCFHRQAGEAVPEDLRAAIDPLIRMAGKLTAEIQRYDRKLERLAERKYPETALLKQVAGVGTVTALAYRLKVADQQRFAKSRDVGPYLGLTRRRDQSGGDDPELGISKAGDDYLRRLLVGSAHYILGPFGPDTDLRRFGLRLMGEEEPGRKNKKPSKGRKKLAVVAVARKLAVLLHALWTSGELYEPLRNSQPATAQT